MSRRTITLGPGLETTPRIVDDFADAYVLAMLDADMTDRMRENLARAFVDDCKSVLMGGTFTDSDVSLLTAESLLARIQKAASVIEAAQSKPGVGLGTDVGLGGIRFIESPLAVRRERVKTYPKRKAKSASHWARMDKKWRKRFGFREVPQAYAFSANALMSTPAGLLIHPSQTALVRNIGSLKP